MREGRHASGRGLGTSRFRRFSRRHSELAQEWRLEVLPADFTRVSSEVELEKIYSSFIEAANQLVSGVRPELRTRSRKSFRAAEENRAVSSLHALLREPNDWRAALPGEYTGKRWHNYTDAEVSLLQKDDIQVRENIHGRLRSRLLLAEVKASARKLMLASDKLLDRVQENLPPDAVRCSVSIWVNGNVFSMGCQPQAIPLFAMPCA